jgi:hypothetical protein
MKSCENMVQCTAPQLCKCSVSPIESLTRIEHEWFTKYTVCYVISWCYCNHELVFKNICILASVSIRNNENHCTNRTDWSYPSICDWNPNQGNLIFTVFQLQQLKKCTSSIYQSTNPLMSEWLWCCWVPEVYRSIQNDMIMKSLPILYSKICLFCHKHQEWHK